MPNKLTAEVQAAIAETGETPRDYMLRVMRDETVDHARRDAMAKAVAPYCHPQLASVATTNETGRHADNMTEEELIKAIEEQANRLGWKIDFGHSTTSRAMKRSGQGPSCQAADAVADETARLMGDAPAQGAVVPLRL